MRVADLQCTRFRKAYRIALAAFEHGASYYTVDSQQLLPSASH